MPAFRSVRRSTFLFCVGSMLSMRALVLGPRGRWVGAWRPGGARRRADGPDVRPRDARQLGAAGRRGDRLAARRAAATPRRGPRSVSSEYRSRSLSGVTRRRVAERRPQRAPGGLLARATARASCPPARSPKASASRCARRLRVGALAARPCSTSSRSPHERSARARPRPTHPGPPSEEQHFRSRPDLRPPVAHGHRHLARGGARR